ncbi:hypothetical protein FisN_7Lu198 [Fistulifera solaris]|uniref:Uncharacterized protein n=1 Tax=Fistulifera solaris TaxID=1519565 RepID=A0A1Z5JCR7_FISSO|nr:hypothetical protein FisN_7Lu198 [Fistulifera solaris]|eukprot:GAX11794.1 hypothetical protein FisN_7Lu198 [Fistulifera solaris]
MKDQSSSRWTNTTLMPLRLPNHDNDEWKQKSLRLTFSPTSTMVDFSNQVSTNRMDVVSRNSDQQSFLGTIASSLSDDEDEELVPIEIEFMAISRQSSNDSDCTWHDIHHAGEKELLGLQFVNEDVLDDSHESMSVQSVRSVTHSYSHAHR